jgi:hypothetical protein
MPRRTEYWNVWIEVEHVEVRKEGEGHYTDVDPGFGCTAMTLTEEDAMRCANFLHDRGSEWESNYNQQREGEGT